MGFADNNSEPTSPFSANPRPVSGVSSGKPTHTLNQSEKSSFADNPFVKNCFNSVAVEDAESKDAPVLGTKRSRRRKKYYSARETAIYRCGVTAKIAAGLEESSEFTAELRAETLAVADCLRETALPENIYFSVGQTNSETGESFEGYGSLAVAVGTRLCPNYQAKQSRRRNRRIRKSLAAQGVTDDEDNLLVNEDGNLKNFANGVRLRFVTLSMPELCCAAEEKLSILDRALVLFKKRSIWVDNVLGAYVSEEFTDGEASSFRWNFHAHALLVSKWIERDEIGNDWTDCVEKACEDFRVEFPSLSSPTNRLHVWINDVATYARENQVSLDSAVFEISKYLSKGSDILNVPVAELAALNRTLSGRRMFEPYGIFNSHRGTQPEQETSDAADTPLLDNRTQLTAEEETESESAVELRRETLVERGTRMILEGRRSEWLLDLRKEMGRRRAWRRKQLLTLYPRAVFWTLDGRMFRNHGDCLTE
jgi:hypothetical protein